MVKPAQHNEANVRFAGQPLGYIEGVADRGDMKMIREKINKIWQRRATVEEDRVVIVNVFNSVRANLLLCNGVTVRSFG